MRLNKFLAHTSGLSRRQADEAIEQGRVTINGSTASLGAEVQPNDIVTLDDRVVSKPTDYLYVLYNKPAGLVCSRRQQGDADTIYNQIPEEYQKLKTVGRLDKDSSGILLLTDNGDLAHELTHPKFAKEKIYKVELDKPLDQADISKINSGVELEDGTSQMQLSEVSANKGTVTMNEGRNRQIRRTFEALGYTVTKLHRIKFGDFSVKGLEVGETKEISV